MHIHSGLARQELLEDVVWVLLRPLVEFRISHGICGRRVAFAFCDAAWFQWVRWQDGEGAREVGDGVCVKGHFLSRFEVGFGWWAFGHGGQSALKGGEERSDNGELGDESSELSVVGG